MDAGCAEEKDVGADGLYGLENSRADGDAGVMINRAADRDEAEIWSRSAQ